MSLCYDLCMSAFVVLWQSWAITSETFDLWSLKYLLSGPLHNFLFLITDIQHPQFIYTGSKGTHGRGYCRWCTRLIWGQKLTLKSQQFSKTKVYFFFYANFCAAWAISQNSTPGAGSLLLVCGSAPILPPWQGLRKLEGLGFSISSLESPWGSSGHRTPPPPQCKKKHLSLGAVFFFCFGLMFLPSTISTMSSSWTPH